MGLPLADFPNPATTIHVVEVTATAQSFVNMKDSGVCGTYTSYSTSGDCIWAGHLGTGNYLFTDGHAKSLRIDQTFNPTVNMWRRDNAPFTGGDLTNAKTNVTTVTQRYN